MTAKPQAEVIQEWADFDSDGYTFERGRMEKAVQSICFGDNPAALPASIAQGPSAGLKLKKDDVDLLTNQLLLSRPAAEAALARHGGDLSKTLHTLVVPPAAPKDAQIRALRALFAQSTVVNDPKAWDQAWLDSTTPWDALMPQPALLELLDGVHDADCLVEALDGTTVPVSHVVPRDEGVAVVPGCGRGYDAKVFAERGLQSFGVDISATAVAAANKWLETQNLPPSLSDRIHFLTADFFALATASTAEPALARPAGAVVAYDYTFLCALPPSLRPAWAETYTRLLQPGGILLPLVFPIQGDRPGGPPFSLSTDLVRRLLAEQRNADGSSAWRELADLEPKKSKEGRVGQERIMVWRRV